MRALPAAAGRGIACYWPHAVVGCKSRLRTQLWCCGREDRIRAGQMVSPEKIRAFMDSVIVWWCIFKALGVHTMSRVLHLGSKAPDGQLALHLLLFTQVFLRVPYYRMAAVRNMPFFHEWRGTPRLWGDHMVCVVCFNFMKTVVSGTSIY